MGEILEKREKWTKFLRELGRESILEIRDALNMMGRSGEITPDFEKFTGDQFNAVSIAMGCGDTVNELATICELAAKLVDGTAARIDFKMFADSCANFWRENKRIWAARNGIPLAAESLHHDPEREAAANELIDSRLARLCQLGAK